MEPRLYCNTMFLLSIAVQSRSIFLRKNNV